MTQQDTSSNELSPCLVAENFNEMKELTSIHYDKEIKYLTEQLSKAYSDSSDAPPEHVSYDSLFSECYLAKQLIDNNEEYERFIDNMKQVFQRINMLLMEANAISNEMQRPITYSLILQTPISYLKPNERSVQDLCSFAVQVNCEKSSPQIWDIEKFEYKLNHMKHLHKKWTSSENKVYFLKQAFQRNNPFFDERPMTFIGVANIYLKGLFYDSNVDYIVPIINTQGQNSGSLHVVLNHHNSLLDDTFNKFQRSHYHEPTKSNSISSGKGNLKDTSALSNMDNQELSIKFSIKEARNLPRSNAEYVVCNYTFINPKLDETVTSERIPSSNLEQNSSVVLFRHQKEYKFPIRDNFLSKCYESVVSIEVWYQESSVVDAMDVTEDEETNRYDLLARSLGYQWKCTRRYVEFAVEIHELDASGEWMPVQVDLDDKIPSGGIYRLKQGTSKRLVIKLRVLLRSNSMPLVLDEIRSVEIGSIHMRKTYAPCQLDSYQDDDLQVLKEQWLECIQKRRKHIESKINQLNAKTEKTEMDMHAEEILLNQILRITDEQELALFPPSVSGIPGAPAAWNVPPTIENHRPIIFLNINPVDSRAYNSAPGLEARLSDEIPASMVRLPLVQNASDENRAVAQWDSSLHESPIIYQITPKDSIVYMIVKVSVLLSQPVHVELVLRKRIAITIDRGDKWWPEKTLKHILNQKTYKRTSVVYEIVSSIPKALYDTEDQNKIALQLVSKASINKYIQCGSNIDGMILVDKLRQELALIRGAAKRKQLLPHLKTQTKPTNEQSSSTNFQHENFSSEPVEVSNCLKLSSDLNESTPSMLSRALFIEEEQIQAIQNSKIFIKPSIELNNEYQEGDTQALALEERYLPRSDHSYESLCRTSMDNSSIINGPYCVGSRVEINTEHTIQKKLGTIRYVGELDIKPGTWYGIELDEPLGKNDGSLNGHMYFECPPRHGIFVRQNKIRLIDHE